MQGEQKSMLWKGDREAPQPHSRAWGFYWGSSSSFSWTAELLRVRGKSRQGVNEKEAGGSQRNGVGACVHAVPGAG